MSGPIIRKYGFPNFDKIFGKKDLQHGSEDPQASSAEKQLAQAVGAESNPAPPNPDQNPAPSNPRS